MSKLIKLHATQEAIERISSLEGVTNLEFINEQYAFKLNRFIEKTKVPVESEWSIRIYYIRPSIAQCKISLNGIALPWWDSREDEEIYYAREFDSGGAGIVRIPRGQWEKIEDDFQVTIYDKDVQIYSCRWGDISKVRG